MRFLLKKTSKSPNEISLEELIKLLDLASLRDSIKKLELSIEELKKTSNVDEKTVLNIIKTEALLKGEIMNLTQASSIEKIKNIKPGILRFDKDTEELRLKLKNKWVTLNFK